MNQGTAICQKGTSRKFAQRKVLADPTTPGVLGSRIDTSSQAHPTRELAGHVGYRKPTKPATAMRAANSASSRAPAIQPVHKSIFCFPSRGISRSTKAISGPSRGEFAEELPPVSRGLRAAERWRLRRDRP